MKISNEKPRMLLFPFDQLAHYTRCLSLARRLSPFFRISVACSGKYEALIEGEGLEHFPCTNFDGKTVNECSRKFSFAWMNEKNMDAVLRDQVRAIEQYQPAFVLGDAMPTLKMAAEHTGVPYISLMNGYMSRFYGNTRRLSIRFPLYRYMKRLPTSLLDHLTRKGEAKAFQSVHAPFRKLRAKYGLSPKETYPEEMEGDYNLICDLPQLFPQQGLPAHYQLIPPLFYEPGEPRMDWGSLLHKEKKTLFVSMGSTGDWKDVAFLKEPPFQEYNIVTAGDHDGVLRGQHVVPASFVDFHALFPFVDAVLCHGGNGTVYQALYYGIPLLCRTSHFEQEWNTHVLQHMQLGTCLDEVQSPDSVLELIQEWIDKKNRGPLREISRSLMASQGNWDRTIDTLLSWTGQNGYAKEEQMHAA